MNQSEETRGVSETEREKRRGAGPRRPPPIREAQRRDLSCRLQSAAPARADRPRAANEAARLRPAAQWEAAWGRGAGGTAQWERPGGGRTAGAAE